MSEKLREVPQQFAQDWIQKLDGRTKLAQAVRQRLDALQADLGGPGALSYQERSLCRRALWLEALIEQREAALARGEPIDEGSHTQSINALMGVWKALGLKRRSRDVPDLQTYLAQQYGEPRDG
ncbi:MULTISPECIES: hypothetical protein [Halorhodospira]|uniref:hypothetical protein n=1 Tax=Halorhodospira TaxID=85108 RepID=UPI001EE8953A|nr:MULTISPECIES: hypothetical protein [Halorhodospira]MCG5527344.1 hypothetical protein [Halorhodospira halophila]MCG5543662.1 hypothetical protein [Halorhodospira sp. 9628]